MYTKIFVNGTFDLLHCGHLALLKAAKSLGGFVLVAIDSDARVQQLKGPTRPVRTQQQRQSMLEALRYVDFVTVFNSDAELHALVKNYRPDVMVKGSDYKNKPIIGADYCESIFFVEKTNDSTTKTIKNIFTGRQLY